MTVTSANPLAEQVYNRLKDDIFNFRLLPGDNFTETEMAQNYGVSRTPLRDALFRMQREGYLEVGFRRGWKVRPIDFDRLDKLDEQFHTNLVAAAGNEEMTRIHTEVTEKIRIVRRLDFLKKNRVDATYEEHGKILKLIAKRKTTEAQILLRAHITQSKLEVRKITIWMLAEARQQQLQVALPEAVTNGK